MAGSIVKRGPGRYELTVDLGRAANGKRVRRFYIVKGTRKEAEARLVEILGEKSNGFLTASSKLTVGDYLRNWLGSREANGNLAPSAVRTYHSLIEQHIRPSIGGIPLQRLRPVDIQTFYAGLPSHLSANTKSTIHAVLNKALKQAARAGIISSIPTQLVEAPRKPPVDTTRVLTRAQFDAALEFTGSYALYFYMAALTGARRGELLAMLWEDIDLEAGKWTVSQKLDWINADNYTFSPPKSRKARTVDLGPKLVRALALFKRDRTGLVFSWDGKRPTPPSTLAKAWERALESAGLPHYSIHSLRHCMATWALERGVNIQVIRERLGHANIKTTLEHYAWALPSQQAAAARELEMAVGDLSGDGPFLLGSGYEPA